MEQGTVSVVPVAPEHRAEWGRLFEGYNVFYRRELTPGKAEAVWRWLHDPTHEVEGVLAVRDGQAVGLAHYRRMPSPLRGADIGFLDDLFVDPEARGGRIGEVLIAHVAAVARERGWPAVRWLTAEDNYRARSLYDRVGTRTAFILYELAP